MQRSQPRFAMLLAACSLLTVLGQVLGQSRQFPPTEGGNGVFTATSLPTSVAGEQLRSPPATMTDTSTGARPTVTEQVTPPRAMVPATSPTKNTNTTSTQSAVASTNALAGNRLLADAVRDIARHRSIVANIRHRLRLFGHELVGSGTYQQVDIGPDRLLRLELKIPLDDQITSVTQICNARFLYVQETMPNGRGATQTKISRIDLDKVRTAAASDIYGKDIYHDGLLLGQGGLPQLLIELERHFAFYEVRAATWHDVPVWITWGEWKPEVLNRLVPNAAAELDGPRRVAKLPPHMPHIATVVLGREDLLPYQFEYRRKKDSADVQDGSALLDDAHTEPVLTMELFAVEVGGVIDPRQFAFNAGDRLVVDGTRDYLLRATSQKTPGGP